VPDFFIVGHHKSGTTALFEMLRRHPQIYMPDMKEPKFFATDLPARFEPDSSRGLPHTLEEYLALFQDARDDQRVGEASPSYLTSRDAAAAIAQVQPAARIIAILREPASFLYSFHLQMVQSHVESEADLHKALAAEEVNRGGRTFRRYSDHLAYVEQVRRYHAVFAPEQVLVLIYDDFRADNEATLKTVLRFLDVDETVALEVLDTNPTVRVRSPRADRLIQALSVGRGPLARRLRGTIKSRAPQPRRR
jgi:hypothetical protein